MDKISPEQLQLRFETFLVCAVLEQVISQQEADQLLRATTEQAPPGEVPFPPELMSAVGRLIAWEHNYPPTLH